MNETIEKTSQTDFPVLFLVLRKLLWVAPKLSNEINDPISTLTQTIILFFSVMMYLYINWLIVHSELTRTEINFHFLVLNYPTEVNLDRYDKKNAHI